MTLFLDGKVQRVFDVYRRLGRLIMPEPRAFALRGLEEHVELALKCGASVRDVYLSAMRSLENERWKDPALGYDERRMSTPDGVIEELADVVLIVACTARSASVSDAEIDTGALLKVQRLEQAADEGTLHITDDGRIYRRSMT